MISVRAKCSEGIHTDSLIVSERFGKQHKDVLKAIKRIGQRIFAPSSRPVKNDASSDFFKNNFKLGWYMNGQCKRQPLYHITKDGFSFLVMGFTGPEAAKFKIEFINAFNNMEDKLKQAEPLYKEMYAAIVNQQKRIQELEQAVRHNSIYEPGFGVCNQQYIGKRGSVTFKGYYKDDILEDVQTKLYEALALADRDSQFEILIIGKKGRTLELERAHKGIPVFSGLAHVEEYERRNGRKIA